MSDEPLYRRQRIWLENDMWRSIVNLLRRLVCMDPMASDGIPYPTDEKERPQ